MLYIYIYIYIYIPAYSAVRWQEVLIEEDPGNTEVQVEDPVKPAGMLFQAPPFREELKFMGFRVYSLGIRV